MTTPLYITRPDLGRFYGDTEINRIAAGGIDIDSIIAAVNAEVHSYVQRISKEALLEIPVALKSAAADIVRFRLYTSGENKLLLERYTHAIEYLKAISKGSVVLPFASPDANQQPDTGSLASVTEMPRVMSHAELTFW